MSIEDDEDEEWDIGEGIEEDGSEDEEEEKSEGDDEHSEEERGEEDEDDVEEYDEGVVEEDDKGDEGDEGGEVDACYDSDIAAYGERFIEGVADWELGLKDVGVYSGKDRSLSFLKLKGICMPVYFLHCHSKLSLGWKVIRYAFIAIRFP